jgi:hypothetical protein
MIEKGAKGPTIKEQKLLLQAGTLGHVTKAYQTVLSTPTPLGRRGQSNQLH